MITGVLYFKTGGLLVSHFPNHRQGLKGDFLPVSNGQDQGGPEAQDSYRPFV